MTKTTIKLKPGRAAFHYRLSTQVLITGTLTRLNGNGYRYEFMFETGWLPVLSLDAVDFEVVGAD